MSRPLPSFPSVCRKCNNGRHLDPPPSYVLPLYVHTYYVLPLYVHTYYVLPLYVRTYSYWATITWTLHHRTGRGLEAGSRCCAPPGSQGRQCCNLEKHQLFIWKVCTMHNMYIVQCIFHFEWIKTGGNCEDNLDFWSDSSLKTIRWQ